MRNGTESLSVVTGGAGFIGSHLVEQLVSAGQRVRVIERPGASVDHLPDAVDCVFADICDPDAIRTAMVGASHLYHLAAIPSLWVPDRRDFDRVNHQGTRNVLDGAREVGVPRILHCSTESILTKPNWDRPIDAGIEISELDVAGPYCLSKLRAENLALERGRQGEPIIVVNPTMPVGPGDRGVSPPTRLLLDFCQGRLPAMMHCDLNMIDVRDVAAGILKALERGRPGRRYLLGGENLDLSTFLGKLSKLTGQPLPWIKVPSTIAMATAYLSEFVADYITGNSPKATVTGVRLAQRRIHFDVHSCLQELDLNPRPIDLALQDAISWHQARGDLKVDRTNQTNQTEDSQDSYLDETIRRTTIL